MAESRHERIIVLLQDRLAGRFDRVVRAPAFSEACLDASLTTICVLSPEDVSDEWRDSCTYRSTLRVDLTAITKFNPATENPFQQEDPIRWTVQTRLEHDAKFRILSEAIVLDGSSIQIDIPTTVYSPDTYWEGWAGVFMRLLIRYHWQRAVGP